jgi:hypothetical protein
VELVEKKAVALNKVEWETDKVPTNSRIERRKANQMASRPKTAQGRTRLRHRLWGALAQPKVQYAIFRSDIRAQALICYFSNTPARLLDYL